MQDTPKKEDDDLLGRLDELGPKTNSHVLPLTHEQGSGLPDPLPTHPSRERLLD